MLNEITITRDQFNMTFDEALSHIREAAEQARDPMMLLKMGLFLAVVHTDLEGILFREEKLEVKEETRNGN